MEDIYNAIRNLNAKHQRIILANYKIIELYEIFADNEQYRQYINDLFAISSEYSNRAFALTALHTAAFFKSIEKPNELDLVESIGKIYDCMSEEYKQKICSDMLNKKEFFEEAYKRIMSICENAVEIQKDSEMIEQTEN